MVRGESSLAEVTLGQQPCQLGAILSQRVVVTSATRVDSAHYVLNVMRGHAAEAEGPLNIVGSEL